MLGRVDVGGVDLLDFLSGKRVGAVQRLYLVAEEVHTDRLLEIGRKYFHHIAADPEGAPGERDVVARVVDGDESPQQFVAPEVVTRTQRNVQLLEIIRAAQAVDARDGGNHDDIAAGKNRRGSLQAQAVDLVVDRGVLFYVKVLRGHVGLGLVVIIIGNEVLDRVLGEELPELAVELGRERLVVREHQRGLLHPLDHLGHGKRLARTGNAEQGLVLHALVYTFRQEIDRAFLVARRPVPRYHFERWHGAIRRSR